jgi:hypothetical protein
VLAMRVHLCCVYQQAPCFLADALLTINLSFLTSLLWHCCQVQSVIAVPAGCYLCTVQLALQHFTDYEQTETLCGR